MQMAQSNEFTHCSQQVHSFALAGKLYHYLFITLTLISLWPHLQLTSFFVAPPKLFLFFSWSLMLVFLFLSALLLQPEEFVLSLQEVAGFTVLSGIPKLCLYFQK